MSTNLLITRDFGGYATNGSQMCRQFTDKNISFSLTADTVTTVTLPDALPGRLAAYFEYTPGSEVFVQPSGSPTLTAPSGTPTVVPYELNPIAREVKPLQELQFLTSGSDVNVVISLYNLPTNS